MAGTDDQPSELRTGDSEDSGVGTVRVSAGRGLEEPGCLPSQISTVH